MRSPHITSSRILRILVLAWFLPFFAGCSGSDPQLISGQTTGTDNVPTGTKLVFATEGCTDSQTTCSLEASGQSEIDLKVKLLGESDSAGVPNVNVRYKIESSSPDSAAHALSGEKVTTDKDGYASIKLVPSDVPGSVTISATAGSGSSTVVLSFTVIIGDPANFFNVKLVHKGSAKEKQLTLYTLPKGTECAQAFTDLQNGTALEVREKVIANAKSAETQVVLPNKGKPGTYTVLVTGTDAKNKNLQVVIGCTKDVASKGVAYYWDELPRLKGTYPITQKFSVGGSICEATVDDKGKSFLCDTLKIFGTMMKEPASFLLGDKDGTHKGIIGLIVNSIEDENTKKTLQGILDDKNIISKAILGAIKNFIDGVGDQVEKVFPKELREGLDISASVIELFKDFEFDGKINFASDPVAKYAPDEEDENGPDMVIGEKTEDDKPPKGSIELSTMRVRWEHNCKKKYTEGSAAYEKCAIRTLDLKKEGLEKAVVTANFDYKIVPLTKEQQEGLASEAHYGLVVPAHAMNINIGAIFFVFLEKVILPSIYNKPDASLKDVFESIIKAAAQGNESETACKALINKALGAASLAVGFWVEPICETVIKTASSTLKKVLLENTIVGSGEAGAGKIGASSGIASDQACPLYAYDPYPDTWSASPYPEVESVSKKGDKACKWSSAHFTTKNNLPLAVSFYQTGEKK